MPFCEGSILQAVNIQLMHLQQYSGGNGKKINLCTVTQNSLSENIFIHLFCKLLAESKDQKLEYMMAKGTNPPGRFCYTWH